MRTSKSFSIDNSGKRPKHVEKKIDPERFFLRVSPRRKETQFKPPGEPKGPPTIGSYLGVMGEAQILFRQA
jgi:hypothetical protein